MSHKYKELAVVKSCSFKLGKDLRNSLPFFQRVVTCLWPQRELGAVPGFPESQSSPLSVVSHFAYLPLALSFSMALSFYLFTFTSEKDGT